MLSREQVSAMLSKAMVELFEIDPARIVPEANIYEDLEIDSIDAIDLIDHIKRETGYRLVADDFRTVRTVASHRCGASAMENTDIRN
ncbi:MAG: acyl carrier protein [Lautropia sp.]|nr:acyl carrier protein [Lautropia sp.]